jgi:carboxymethylenebutenolidase
MKTLTIALAALLASGAHAQDWANKRLEESPRHQEWADVKSGDRTLKCFVVYPERKDKAPVVIVIHEIMGLTDWVMSVADRLAEAGCIAIAPDFLSGMASGGGGTGGFADSGAARQGVGALKPEQITADLNAASDYGLKLPSASGVLAVGGFCWGGSQTFRFATTRADLKAAYVFYGSGPTDAAVFAGIKAPVFGFYGGNDNRVNATIPDSEKMMKDAGKSYEPIIYDGAGHGFMRAGEQPDAQPANRKAFEDGWVRWKDLLKKLG